MKELETRMRAAIYARHSTDKQNPLSSRDQIAACSALAARLGAEVVGEFSDPELSGYRWDRPGLVELLELVSRHEIDVVVCEAIDRIARDGEDISRLGKKLRYHDVRLYTCVEGEIDDIKLAVAGLLGSIFLTNLQKKTLRGLEAAVLAGHVPSRPPYGYRKVNRIGEDGQILKGLIEIDDEAAERVRWILREFAGGRSSRSIAAELNRLGVRSPTGREWNPSTIRGDPKKLTGLINNPLYVGELVWKKRQWKRNPDSERRERVPRMRDESEWIRVRLPDLRIVDDELAQAVKEELTSKAVPDDRSYGRSSKRPRHLLSGLIRCGKCGSSYILNGADYYRCTAYVERKTCDNSVSVRTSVIEESVLGALQHDLLTPEMAKVFGDEFRKEYERLAREAASAAASKSTRVDQLEREVRNLAKNMLSGVISATAARMLAERERELDALKAQTGGTPSRIARPPDPDEILKSFERRASALRASLNDPGCREEAASTVQKLIERVVVDPERREAEIVARGDTLVRFGVLSGSGDPPKGNKTAIQVVAGTGFGHKPVIATARA